MGSRQRKRAAARAANSSQSTVPPVSDDPPATSTAPVPSPNVSSPAEPPPTPPPDANGATLYINFPDSYAKIAGNVDADTLQKIRKLANLEGQVLFLKEVTEAQKRESVLQYEKGFAEGRQAGFQDGHALGCRMILDGLPDKLEGERRAGFEEGLKAARGT
ncbi:hypothetical protein DENSPDRAFT_883408 [Dentipellis sp. KUC8613]|nr:hypothetical protein DENSPDRAFT_883408 [Dentipellis sp. KUC8613]